MFSSFLGEGRCTHVFKGWIDKQTLLASKPGFGMAVAIIKYSPEGFLDHGKWSAEVNYLGCFLHQNLIELIGYCLEDENSLLVYEFHAKWKLGRSPFQELSLQEFNPKLSVFSLAGAGRASDDIGHAVVDISGWVYAAPEFLLTGALSAKCNIYSFGVILLELLSGRCAVDMNRASVGPNLVDWAKPYWGDEKMLFNIMDHRLDGQYPKKGARVAVAVAVMCLSTVIKVRPTMAEVLTVLERISDANNTSKRLQ
ncbi:hypothetical protein Scep_026390 [Stephania cephalantha]|uniref:Protein kinase domain-containing protein n=1 Tax=Stephania cephalantha TaxID=152367 RepID=A0AAP0HSH0_9MAGN